MFGKQILNINQRKRNKIFENWNKKYAGSNHKNYDQHCCVALLYGIPIGNLPNIFFIKLLVALSFKTPGNIELSYYFSRCISAG